MKSKGALSKIQKYLLGFAIVISSLAVSIRSGEGKVKLVLQNYPILIFAMVVLSSLLVVLYFQITKRKVENLSIQIKGLPQANNEDFKTLMGKMTERQKEVYDLIILGKTNKEIRWLLFIEQSTLKSHINQIYKKLNIKNRRELKSKLNN